MSEALHWRKSQAGNWWLALPLGQNGWKGAALVFRRDSESPWTATLPDRDGPKPVRDVPCVSLQAAAQVAEEWAEAHGFSVGEPFSAE